MLYTAVEESPSAESVGPEIIARHFSSFDEVFFQYCDKELKKINTFYSGELCCWQIKLLKRKNGNDCEGILFP